VNGGVQSGLGRVGVEAVTGAATWPCVCAWVGKRPDFLVVAVVAGSRGGFTAKVTLALALAAPIVGGGSGTAGVGAMLSAGAETVADTRGGAC
jgi:hypothetical protein